MKIWYEEELSDIRNCPRNTIITIQGIINDVSPKVPLIAIQLYISSDNPQDTAIAKVLYTHNPTMRYPEHPSAEDILAKYGTKIAKFRDKILNMDYKDIISAQPTKGLSFNSGAT